MWSINLVLTKRDKMYICATHRVSGKPLGSRWLGRTVLECHLAYIKHSSIVMTFMLNDAKTRNLHSHHAHISLPPHARTKRVN